MKYAVRLTLGLALLLGTLLVAVAIVIGSESGRLWLVDRGLQFAQDAGLEIEVTDLRSPNLGRWSMAGLRVYKQQALLLKISQLELRWEPQALLQKQLHVNQLTAEAVDYYQQESAEKVEPDQDPAPMPQLPSSPLAIVVDQLGLQTVTLHGISLPESQALPSYQVQGSASAFTSRAPLSLQLNIQSLSNPEDGLKIQTQVTEGSAVRLKGLLYESSGGLLGTLARLPEKQAIDLDFEFVLQQQHERFEVAIERLQTSFLGHQLKARGTLSYHPSQETLHIKQLVLQSDQKRHLIEGMINSDDLWLEAKLKHFPLDVASPWVPELESGNVDGYIRISWLYRDSKQLPEVTTDSTTTLVYNGQNMTAELHGQLKNGLITLSPSSVQVEQTTMKLAGQLDLQAARSALDVEIRNFSSTLLAPWPVPVPPALEVGADVVKLHLAGSLQSPQLAVDGELTGQYQKQPFYLLVAGTGTDTQATIREFNLVAQGSEIDAEGTLDWTGDDTNLTVVFDDVKHTLLQLAPPAVKEAFPQELTLTADGRAQIQGPLQKPKIQTKSTLSGQYRLEGQTLPYEVIAEGQVDVGSPAELQLGIQQLTLKLAEKPTVNISGHYRKQGLDLRVQLMRMPTQLLSALGWKNIDGEAEADLQLTGDLESPELAGFVELRSAEPTAEKRPPTPFALRANLLTENKQLQAQIGFSYQNKDVGDVRVQLPLAAYLQAQGPLQNLPLDLRAKGTMDLKVSTLFLDPVVHQLEGLLETDIHLQGTVSQPDFSGSVAITDGYYHNAIYNTSAHDIDMLIVGTGETLTIKKARARNGDDGYLELDGVVHWQHRGSDEAIELALRANEFILVRTDELYSELAGKASLKGSFEELWLKGRFEVSPLRASIEAAIKNPIPTIEVTEIDDREEQERPKLASQLPRVNLELAIVAGQQAYLRGRGLDTELAGSVTITGTAENPQFVGRFQTVRGRLELFGKRFTLKNGEVLFSNDTVSLHIPAVYKTQDIEIRAVLSGTADKPELTLSSVPELPQDELMARLIFGKSVQDITPFQAYQLASAVNTLRSGGGFDPIDNARKMLGVDSLTVDREQVGEGEDSALTLGVGKYVNEKVYVELKSSQNPSQPWQGNIQVELNSNLTLESGTSENSGANARLMWKRDY